MFSRYGPGRRIMCLVVIISLKCGRPIWSIPPGAQILFLAEPSNATFDSFETHYSDESFTINTVGCVIPAVNIFDISIRKYIHIPKRLIPPCPHYEHRLLENNKTHIWTVKENYKYFNINIHSNLVCCYRPFYRPQSFEGMSPKIVDNRIQYLDCIMFRNVIEVNNEFVKVTCFFDTNVIYDQFFIFTPKKQFTFNREKPFKEPVNQTMYNIIIMGLGSMSRQNFYRTMPNTLQMLKKHSAVELKGYNTVADDTFQNIIPVLVGMNKSELINTCWPRGRTTLDSCPFIWERFKDMGYYTALMEDTARYGMFNLEKFGFEGSPTDYYAHPFIYESEKMGRKRKIVRKLERLKLIQYLMAQRSHEPISTCMGDKYNFEVLLNYVESLTTTLRKLKLFGLFWETSMSHDYLNDPIKMDKAYVTLIRKLESTGYLNDTILIFLSDHGMDIGEIHLTKQGRIEQRLPFVFIVAPPSFRQQYRLAYHNLKVNMGRLTTPYDLHNTLLDLIDLNYINEEEILKRSREFYTQDRGISLFLQIPRNRTCELASISNKWCACYNYVKIAHDNPVVQDAISYMTYQMNEILRPYPECLKLIVDDIIVAKEMLPVYENNVEWRDFNVIVRVAPGGAIYETIMRYYNQEWKIVDHVKRLNFPGYRSLCVKDVNIKLYCYCK